MQGFFSNKKAEKWHKTAINPCKIWHFSPLFKPVAAVDVKTKTPPNTRCCVGWCYIYSCATKYRVFRIFCRDLLWFLIIFPCRYPARKNYSSSSSPWPFLPLSISRCSCILAAEAVRKRALDCFTSSSAACTASSVRASASSAYSLATRYS